MSKTLSRIGLGIMRWPDTLSKKHHDMIEYSIGNGLNYFEACRFYNNWKCEENLKTLLKPYSRDSYFLCDKMSLRGDFEKEKNPEKYLQEQLDKCNTDYFDYYLLQYACRDTWNIVQQEKLVDFLYEKKRQGILRNIGFSFHDNEEWLRKFLDISDWDCVQLQLNYLDWFINNHATLYVILDDKNIPAFVMGGLKGGVLTKGLPSAAVKYLYEQDEEKPIGNWGMEFLAALPNVHMVLSGATELWELRNNMAIMLEQQPKILNLEVYEKVSDIYAKSEQLPCTGCGYCERDCPIKKPISVIFGLYNILLNEYNDVDKSTFLEIQMNPKYGMLNCTHCGKCNKNCPQKINVEHKLQQIALNYR